MKKVIRIVLVVLSVLAVYLLGYKQGRDYGKLESELQRLEEREKEF